MTNARFRLDTLKPSKRSLASLAAIPLATTAHGAITPVDVTFGTSDSLYLDFDGGTFATTSQAGSDVKLNFLYGGSEKPYVQGLDAWEFANSSGSFVQLFDIGATTTTSSTYTSGYIEGTSENEVILIRVRS